MNAAESSEVAVVARLRALSAQPEREDEPDAGGSPLPVHDEDSSDDAPLGVLVVDDDLDVHGALEDVIRDACAAVVAHAFDGSKALDAARATPPDVIFLDIRMPVMDGLAFRQEMLGDPRLQDTYLVVFTGQELSKAEIQVLMPDDVLNKPPAALRVHEIMDLVRKRRSDRRLRQLMRSDARISRLIALRDDVDEMIDDERRKRRKLDEE